MFCYYCGSESDSVEELARKCPGRHLRGVLGGEGKTSVNKNKEKQVNCKLLIFYQLTNIYSTTKDFLPLHFFQKSYSMVKDFRP
jgi:hypothetical protein